MPQTSTIIKESPGSAFKPWVYRFVLILTGSAALLYFGLAASEPHFFTAGIPLALGCFIMLLLGQRRWRAFSHRQRALVGCSLVLLITIPEVFAQTVLMVQSHLAVTPVVLLIGALAVVQFGARELWAAH
ncbi:MAG: hypothetical protein EA352_01025 [Gemmatimonadales bacterium]|nr:MAG: hypothetical protein EA352_01025 [Gemmatimonadales bacterium]